MRIWFDATPNEDLFVSVLALGEIRKGIEILRSRDPKTATVYERWLTSSAADFTDRILPITEAIADRWGRLSAMRPLSVTDGLMAATALTHSLTFVTRNAADVQHTGVSILNPF